VTWEGGAREGVFIPRRDTGSLFNRLLGGRLFPGEHQRARFEVEESRDRIALRMQSADDAVRVEVDARVAATLPPTSIFAGLDEASRFFEGGSVGYSATAAGDRLDGLTLHTQEWKVEPLDVNRVYSSFFADEAKFPPGSATFDCALLMREVPVMWNPLRPMLISGSSDARPAGNIAVAWPVFLALAGPARRRNENHALALKAHPAHLIAADTARI